MTQARNLNGVLPTKSITSHGTKLYATQTVMELHSRLLHFHPIIQLSVPYLIT